MPTVGRAKSSCRRCRKHPLSLVPLDTVPLDTVPQEVELLAVLDHPNIIKLYETFQDKSKLCALPVLSRNHLATQRVEAAIVGSIRRLPSVVRRF